MIHVWYDRAETNKKLPVEKCDRTATSFYLLLELHYR
jgi:hypothetical protein